MTRNNVTGRPWHRRLKPQPGQAAGMICSSAFLFLCFIPVVVQGQMALQPCQLAMFTADQNKDLYLDPTEYILWLGQMAKAKNFAFTATNFGELPTQLQTTFATYAAFSGNPQLLDIHGSSPGTSTTSPQQGASLDQLCTEVSTLLTQLQSTVSPTLPVATLTSTTSAAAFPGVATTSPLLPGATTLPDGLAGATTTPVNPGLATTNPALTAAPGSATFAPGGSISTVPVGTATAAPSTPTTTVVGTINGTGNIFAQNTGVPGAVTPASAQVPVTTAATSTIATALPGMVPGNGTTSPGNVTAAPIGNGTTPLPVVTKPPIPVYRVADTSSPLLTIHSSFLLNIAAPGVTAATLPADWKKIIEDGFALFVKANVPAAIASINSMPSQAAGLNASSSVAPTGSIPASMPPNATATIANSVINPYAATVNGSAPPASSLPADPGFGTSTVPVSSGYSTMPASLAYSTAPVYAAATTVPLVAGYTTSPSLLADTTAPGFAGATTAPFVTAATTAPLATAATTAPLVAAATTAPLVMATSAPVIAGATTVAPVGQLQQGTILPSVQMLAPLARRLETDMRWSLRGRRAQVVAVTGAPTITATAQLTGATGAPAITSSTVLPSTAGTTLDPSLVVATAGPTTTGSTIFPSTAVPTIYSSVGGSTLSPGTTATTVLPSAVASNGQSVATPSMGPSGMASTAYPSAIGSAPLTGSTLPPTTVIATSTLVEDSPRLLDIWNSTSCSSQPNATAVSSCLVVFGVYNVLVASGASRQAVYDALVTSTQSAVDNGALQMSLNTILPAGSGITIVRASTPVDPQPEAAVTAAPVTAAPGTAAPTTEEGGGSNGFAVGAGVTIGVVSLLACCCGGFILYKRGYFDSFGSGDSEAGGGDSKGPKTPKNEQFENEEEDSER